MRDYAIFSLLVPCAISLWYLRSLHIARVRSGRSSNVFVGADTAPLSHVALRVAQIEDGQRAHDEIERFYREGPTPLFDIEKIRQLPPATQERAMRIYDRAREQTERHLDG